MADQKLTELSEKNTPADADLTYLVSDPTGSPLPKKLSWANIKATLKSYFDTVYGSITAVSSNTSHRTTVTGNPHAVTKSEVGLGNVPNVDATNASNISSGTLPTSVFPPVALVSVQIAASEAAMLALTTEQGDVVVRSDENKSYMHNGGTAGTMADFTELQTPTDAVLSVNSETGAVVLTTGDISEDADANYVSDAQLVVIGNTSGSNSGDNATNTQYENRAVAGTNNDITSMTGLNNDGIPLAKVAGAISTYTHTASSAAAVWTVNHNLGNRYVTCDVLVNNKSVRGTYDEPEINFVSTTQLTVTFETATAGVCVVTGG